MIYSDTLLKNLELSRVACFGGSVSSGKTLLSFDIYLSFFARQGYKLYTNVPNTCPTQLPFDVPVSLTHTVVIADEGGQEIRSAKLAGEIVNSAGKADTFYFFPSKKLPHKDLQELIIEPIFDFDTMLGLPLKLWRCNVTGWRPTKFLFWQIFPSGLYGLFATGAPGATLKPLLLSSALTVASLSSNYGVRQLADYGQSTLDNLADDLSSKL